MAHDKRREVLGGLVFQGASEGVFYSFDTAPWGGTPSAVSHDVFDEDDLTTSLKGSLCPGSPSPSGDIITLPKLSGGTVGKVYRVTVAFTNAGGQELEGFMRVKFED